MKEELFKSLTDGEMSLSSDDVRKCKETTTHLKESKKLLNVKRKESSIWRIN